MKKLTNIILLFSMLLLVAACGDDKPKAKPKANPVDMTKDDAKDDTADAPPTDPVPPEQLAKAKEIIATVGDDAVGAVDAKAKYKMLCTACHGMDGKLNVNGAKDLSKSVISLENSVAQIYFGKGLMTPFKGMLKDEEIVAVANYIQTLRN